MKKLTGPTSGVFYMADEAPIQSEHQTSIRAWEQTAPWIRRFSMRIGLEGKLILCFMTVLCAALATTATVFNNETHERISDIMGEQARQVATALSLTSERMARTGSWDELNFRARELIKSRNILYVGFLDANARAKTLASRDLDFQLANLTFDSQSLMQVSHRRSATLGEYLEVTAPILTVPDSPSDAAELASTRRTLLGYVSVGISQVREETQLNRVHYIVIGIACVTLVASLPIALFLVHRIFLPIRQLVTVTRKIASGDFTARTEIHRPDIIGDLARSFDDMVVRVKQHQEELADANRDLEHKIEQRTAQLETANTRLQSEITEKEEFLRAVSHDLNAPLRNIAGMTTMLLAKHRESFAEDVVYRLERIKSNVDVQTDLIGELLELSRIKTRRLKIETVETSKLIEDLRGLFENDLRSRSIDLVVDTPLPVLTAERSRIRQIFQNLIDNAIKYMGEGPTRRIHIGCTIGRTEAEFYVRDTGMGIDPGDLDKVFFVFRRGRNGASGNIAGKGVGLASVKSIVETYNGKIWVTSEPGRGSTFSFTVNGKFVPQPDGRAAA